MAQNFFSTVWSRDPLEPEEDADDDLDLNSDPNGIKVLSGGPTYVKSQQQTLLSEEHDIRQSRSKKATITFAKPKPQPKRPEKVSKPTDDADENFVRKDQARRMGNQKTEKVRQLEEQVNDLYGSKAYKMLQKMSMQKNKRDVTLKNLDGADTAETPQDEEESKEFEKKKFTLGEGLGKHGQGIINPVKADILPSQGGIGTAPKNSAALSKKHKNRLDDAVDRENVASTIDLDIHDKAGEKQKQEQEEASKKRLDAEDKAFLDLFQKNRQEKRKNFRNEYAEMQSKFKVDHGAEEVHTAASSMQETMKKLNIIDMTGSALQVQTSLTQFESKAIGKAIRSELLLKKVLKAKDEAKFNVKALVQREEYQENYKLQLEQEQRSLQSRTGGSQLVIKEMKDFQNELKQISDVPTEIGSETTAALHDKCADLAARFPTLYQQHDISYSFAAKLLKEQLVTFNFETQGLANFDTFLAVRNLITIGCPKNDQESKDRNKAFLQIAFDTYWMGPFRQYVSGKLNIKTESGLLLLNCFSQWTALMPDQVIKKVVQQTIMPKLTSALQVWSARDGELETWLAPWCELIGKKNMKLLFESVKQQLIPSFSDKKLFKKHGVKLMKPWVRVLEKAELRNFANRYVYPRVTSMVKRLEVDPSDQKLSPLDLLFNWSRLLPATISEEQAKCILCEHLLPKLLLTLQQWLEVVLGGDNEAYGEIMVWYSGWKQYLLDKNSDVVPRDKTEEVFYLMMLMIDRKVSQN